MAELALVGPMNELRAIAPTVIEPASLTTTAFVGRTLRGPLNQPQYVDDFAAFQRVFGGLWQPSTLSYAVEQFFEQGGKSAVVVRVSNSARCVQLTLPAGYSTLTLRALNPGTREYLRASVDYDGIPAADSDCFNLVVQRLREAGTEQIEDQELFRRVTILTDGDRCVREVLASSSLVRLHGEMPLQRPDRTPGPEASMAVGYVAAENDGDDGDPLSDYDLIGSAEQATGLFALRAAEKPFGLLCIPPLTRERDVGLTTWMVAARICRERQALLIVDPPAAWSEPDQTLQLLRQWAFSSTDACMFYPRILCMDRLRGRTESFVPCGAVAGLLAQSETQWPPWQAAAAEEMSLRAPAQCAVNVNDGQRQQLAMRGVNTLRGSRRTSPSTIELRTLLPDAAARSDFRLLGIRRLSQCVTSSILHGTRWAALQIADESLWQKLQQQVESFLELLMQQGAFVGSRTEDSCFVICDQRLNPVHTSGIREVNLAFGFAPVRPAEFHTWLLSIRPAVSVVRPVSVNRVQLRGWRGDEAVETALLRRVGLS